MKPAGLQWTFQLPYSKIWSSSPGCFHLAGGMPSTTPSQRWWWCLSEAVRTSASGAWSAKLRGLTSGYLHPQLLSASASFCCSHAGLFVVPWTDDACFWPHSLFTCRFLYQTTSPGGGAPQSFLQNSCGGCYCTLTRHSLWVEWDQECFSWIYGR